MSTNWDQLIPGLLGGESEIQEDQVDAGTPSDHIADGVAISAPIGDSSKDAAPGIEFTTAHYWRVYYPAIKTRAEAESLYEDIFGEKPRMVFDQKGQTWIGPCPGRSNVVVSV